MRVGVLGTGQVGRAIGGRLVADGHEVVLGSRTADNSDARAWTEAAGAGASHGTFADAAAAGDLLFNCTPGTVSLDVLASVAPGDLAGKVLVDVSNPLDFSAGFPPILALSNTTSLGEEIQRAHPDTKVVKALNTMNNSVMVDPSHLPATHHLFLCGDDADAKATVGDLLAQWGWTPEMIVDLGDITNARGTEMLLPLWVRLAGAFGTADFNLAVVR